MTPEAYSYKSFIKDIYIELPDYKYNHTPLGEDRKDGTDDNFIGRKRNEDKLLNILTDSGNNGAYLITGYRGMGKTSFVKRVLTKFEKQQNEEGIRISKINISFAQFDLKEKDILKQITKSLIVEAEQNPWILFFRYVTFTDLFRFIIFFISGFILSLVLFYLK